MLNSAFVYVLIVGQMGNVSRAVETVFIEDRLGQFRVKQIAID